MMLKQIELEKDFTVYRTDCAVSREVAMLSEPALSAIWAIYSCPYLAFADEPGRAGLLKEDVSAHLLPDVNAPMSIGDEDRLLTALATLHARYWKSEVLDLPWLTCPKHIFGLLGPHAAAEEASREAPHMLLQVVSRGWEEAFDRLPARIVNMLSRPADVLAAACADLPQTLLHGDTKVANFALLPDGGVVAFDWALIGAGPATLDLGWYLAVNSGRLARRKQDLVLRYRSLLETMLGSELPEALWTKMVSAGILCGALMSLWEKALNVTSGNGAARREWEWWVDRLEEMTRQ
jgi:thiamine kinase-like enzyme